MAGPVTFSEEKLQEIAETLSEIRDLLRSADAPVQEQPAKPAPKKALAKKTSAKASS